LNNESSLKLLVNPVAAGGRCNKSYPKVVKAFRELGIECDVLVSEYPGHITAVASELAARGCETLVACGGDGTINEVINGIAGTQTALGAIPMGTTNFFAASVGIGRDLTGACKSIKARRARAIDLIRVNDQRLFAGTACMGFDAHVAASLSAGPAGVQSVSRALNGGFRLFSRRPKTVELRFGGQRFFGEALLVAFSRASEDGSDSAYNLEPGPRETALDVFVGKPIPKRQFFSLFRKGSGEGVTVYRAPSVHVQSVGPMNLYASGDFVAKTPFRLVVIPKHLNVITGPELPHHSLN
jgi:diacylglycerol kinase (ATP)